MAEHFLPISVFVPMEIEVPDYDFLRDILMLLATEEAKDTGIQDQRNGHANDEQIVSLGEEAKSYKRQARKRTSPIPRDSNRSRLDRRYEVWLLREQISVLEVRLRELQVQAKLHTPSKAQPSSNDRGALSGWQAVDKCQLDRLLMAENKRTKQQKWIQKLKNTIKRMETVLQTIPTARICDDLDIPLTAAPEFHELDRFKEISHGLSAMYLQRHGVFSDPRFQTSIHGIHDFRVQNEVTAHLSFEVLESRLLPFSIQATSAAMSYFFQMKKKDVVHESQETNDAIRRTFVFSLDTPYRKFQAVGRTLVRWFIEHDRVVFLQHAEFDQIKRITGWVPEGYVIRQFRWTMVGPPRNEQLRQSKQAMCQVERFEVLIPIQKSSRNDQDFERDEAALKQFVLETTNRVREDECDVIESILLNVPTTISYEHHHQPHHEL